MVKGPEKAQKKEYLRSNEKNYTISKPLLDRGGVMSLKGALPDNIASSLEYG